MTSKGHEGLKMSVLSCYPLGRGSCALMRSSALSGKDPLIPAWEIGLGRCVKELAVASAVLLRSDFMRFLGQDR